MLDKIDQELKKITPNQLGELGSYAVPSSTIVLGLQLTCLFFSKVPDKKRQQQWKGADINGWFDAGKIYLLNDPKKLLADLIKYDKRNMQDNMIKQAKSILDSEDFTIEKVRNASQALVALHLFASGMCKFHELLKIVKPKEEKVQEMKEMLAVVRKQLKEKRQRLKEVEDHLEEIERQF